MRMRKSLPLPSRLRAWGLTCALALILPLWAQAGHFSDRAPAQAAREQPALFADPQDPPCGLMPMRNAPYAGSFTDMSPEQLGRHFSRVYAGRKPKAWGERLPGIVWRLHPAGQGAVFGSGRFIASQSAASLSPLQLPGGAGQNAGRTTLALTLDACGGKKGRSYDAGIIALLREKKIPATIFVSSLWMRNNPEALRDLAADPLFEIAAHGSRHMPCSVNGNSAYGIKGTSSFGELVREVEQNVRDIHAATGRRPLWFRSGTAFYDDTAVGVIRDLGLGLAGYSLAGDEGATLSSAAVAAKTLSAEDGDILLYHLHRPRSGVRGGLERALPLLLEKGCVFVRLSPDMRAQ
jgi:peptidoglycan/xylan/chitin deacetylase (PgdA/CDA1 family)